MTNRPIVFQKQISNLGTLALSPLQIPDDIPVVHDWVTREYATYWGMRGRSVAEVEAAYTEIAKAPRSRVFVGLRDGAPAFLLECHSPVEDAVRECYEARLGDRGMHILMAPPEQPLSGFTWHVFMCVMDFMFSDETAERIVVEPDVRNEKIHRLNIRAGFQYHDIIRLPTKTAYLGFCTRDQYAAALAQHARNGRTDSPMVAKDERVGHLEPGAWSSVNDAQVRKLIREFAHERLLQPKPGQEQDGSTHYSLPADEPGVEYRFRAQLLSLDHWFISPNSIERWARGRRVPLDAVRFILDFRETIGVAPAMLPAYLEEITRTSYAAAYKHATARHDSAALARAGFQEVEGAMIEGHPCFVANSGRVGFDIDDHRSYAPEATADVRLLWLAVHKSRATFSSITGLGYAELVEHELGAATIRSFNETLSEQGLEPEAYLFMPAHPWQWENKLTFIFAPDIAARKLVYLGPSQDRYRAQQSIRTFFNMDHPERHYVKTALSIVNMGFMRGLSPYYMQTTPAINEWIHGLIDADPELRECGFEMLREVAAIGYRHEHYEAVPGDNPYKKMLAALWRESPVPRVTRDERLITMAALLHRDREGAALLPEIIRSSGVAPEVWLQRYLRCYLTPLLHCFYAHELVFMPHGENIILVLRNDAPVRAFIKDIGEEAAIIGGDPALPENIRRLSVAVPEELKVLSIFTDVFDCIFRHVAEVVWEYGVCSEARFWRLVADCVLDYQRSHPEFAEKFRRHDLFAPEFTRSCLNRLQLANSQQMIDLADPAKNLKFEGTLRNPIAPFRSADPAVER